MIKTKNNMKTENKESLRVYAKLGFSHLETAEVVSLLNKLLAAYHVHYQKLRNFHWNVVGPDFFDVHEKFEEQYNEVKLNIDDVAERIRIFDKRPISTLSEYLEISEIKEVKEEITSTQMVREILADFEILLSLMIDVVEAANSVGDLGTQDLINGFIKKMEKTHWMFTAFLKAEKDV